MDKTWRFQPRASEAYGDGVQNFLDFAISHSNEPTSTKIRCPCKDCKNFKCLSSEEVYDHLVIWGIDMTYNPFVLHGEDVPKSQSDDGQYEKTFKKISAENDIFRSTYATNAGEDYHGDDTELSDYGELVKDAKTPLYPGCKKYTKLSAVIMLFNIKANNAWSDKFFTKLLVLLKDLLPEDNTIPDSIYFAKKMLKTFDLDYQKIHACPNDRLLYRKDHEHKESCPKCGFSRWKQDPKTNKIRVGVPAKVLRYFTIIPRFRRMYMSTDNAKYLRWHSDNKSTDGILRHPVDSPVWNNIDSKWPSFSEEIRNLRLGLAADGINPYRNLSSRHSCWPVMLVNYNLPPSLCMDKKFLMLTLIIPGPKQLGNDIDIYLQPLIDDLLLLWTNGVEMYDAYAKTKFTLKAVLLWTINDFPAYGNLAGCSTKGRYACPKCGDGTCSEWLKHGRKFSYRSHRTFLRPYHHFRFKKTWFNGEKELDTRPIPLNGTQVWDQVKDIETDWGKS